MRPRREHATHNHQTYFVTSQTPGRRRLFHVTRWAELFLDTIVSYRNRAYLIHEYVIMPEHFHVLITPKETLERAVQFIKGGFAARAKKELRWSGSIWQVGFTDHRIRGPEDYANHVGYIFRNPVGRDLADDASHYPYCSAFPGRPKDDVLQWLKPHDSQVLSAGSKTPPFQEAITVSTLEN